jgi:hypothetical protein
VCLEFDPLCTERLERVRELEELRLAVGAGPLEGSTEPRPERRSIVANGTSSVASALARVCSNQVRSAASSIGLLVIQRKTASSATCARSSRCRSSSGSIRMRRPVSVTGVTHVWPMPGW